MTKITSIAVFCGSSTPTDEKILSEAEKVGKTFAERGIKLVYGGGARGVMGSAASACHDNGGYVIGVLPEVFNRPDVRTRELQSEIHIVAHMHERKAMMYDLSDAFLILPGGIGTLDEFFEIFTWKQIGFHKKNIALFNIDGFFNPLLGFLDSLVDSGMLSKAVRDSLIVSDDLDVILCHLESDSSALPGKISE